MLSYQARWQWDLTMYLLDLRVTLRNPTTNALLGTASSYHTSMTRKSTEEMVVEVLSNLRGDKPAAAAPSSGPGTAQVQIVQESLTELRIRLVPDEAFGAESRRKIGELVEETFGPEVRYDVELVDAIPQEPSGKYRFCISRVARDHLEAMSV